MSKFAVGLGTHICRGLSKVNMDGQKRADDPLMTGSVPTADAQTQPAQDQVVAVGAGEFEAAFGESLHSALDLSTWLPGENLVSLYGRLEQEIHEAVKQEQRIRERVRDYIFPLLRTRPNRPTEAGVYQSTVQQVERVHSGLLFNGAVEACDATSVTHDTLPVTIFQIGVSLVSYQGDQGTWVHRLYRRDLRVGGLDPVDEALGILERRQDRAGFDARSKRDKLSDLGKRAIMTYAERAVLLRKSSAQWRMGHGNPTPYELLTGSGMPDLLKQSLTLLEELVRYKKFVFVPSGSGARMLLTIGNALRPLEYAIVDTMEDSLRRIVDQGHYTGEWREFKEPVQAFAKDVGSRIIVGTFRASAMAPAQIFYAHADHAHEAALIALGDSTLQEHRGFPMLVDLADRVCSSVFGAESLTSSAQLAYADSGEPFRYFTERQTRA
jgi:hypothetical protein